MNDKIIDIRPYIKRRKSSAKTKQNKYGMRVSCPECDSTDYWKAYVKEHIDKKLYLTFMVCTSDECDGSTIICIADGILK